MVPPAPADRKAPPRKSHLTRNVLIAVLLFLAGSQAIASSALPSPATQNAATHNLRVPPLASRTDATLAATAPENQFTFTMGDLRGWRGWQRPPTLPADHRASEVQQLASWILITRDNQGLPFVIIDKKRARVVVFEARGQLRGASPALMGAARGDQSVPGIGERPMASIQVHERTTPAGRFVAERGRNLQGEDIIWVDYDAAVSLHRVRATNPKERRLQRLASLTARDNRISYGCINVPAAFFDQVVSPSFAQAGRGMVYILPEVASVSAIFGGLKAASYLN